MYQIYFISHFTLYIRVLNLYSINQRYPQIQEQGYMKSGENFLILISLIFKALV